MAPPQLEQAYSLNQAGGDQQQGPKGAQLPSALVVRMTDRQGNSLSGIRVVFTAVSGGGTINPATATTDAQGYARAEWTLGPVAGPQEAAASVSGLPPLTFRAVAIETSPVEIATSLTVTPGQFGLSAIGDTVQLVAYGTDASGQAVPGLTASWRSLDPDIATVDSAGVVTALGNGTARVVASAGSLSSTASITVQQIVDQMVVVPAEDTLGVIGDTLVLGASASDRRGNPITTQSYFWSSSNTSVATVNSWGGVVATGVGSTTISAGAGGSQSSSRIVVLGRPFSRGSSSLWRVAVSPATAQLTGIGSTIRLTAIAYDTRNRQMSGQTFTWSSSNNAVATVSSTGLVTARGAGNAQIRALDGNVAGSATLTVTVPAATLAKVTVSPPTALLTGVGSTVQLAAHAYDGSNNEMAGQSFTWSSANTGVATVSASGLVTAAGAGSVVITARDGTVSGTATVSVSVPPPAPTVAKVTVTPSSAQLTAAGATTQLTAQAYDASNNLMTGQSFSWSSSNASVATVNGSGLVTAAGAGTAQITAKDGSFQGSASVTVTIASSGGSGECANPQPGWIWCDDFEQNRLNSYFEYSNPSNSFVRTAGVGYNGSYAMKAHWNAGQVDAGALHLAFGRTPDSYIRPVDAGTANYRELYWRVYVKNQPGWTGGGANKLTRAMVFANSSWAEAAIAHLWSGGSGSNFLVLDPASGTDTQGNLKTTGYNDFNNLTWLGQGQGATPLFDSQHVGQWYCVEAHAKLNTAGQSNGVFEFWINGQLENRETGLNWLGSFSTYGINAVYVENYWNAGAPQAEDRYIDDFVVSTQPIGCVGSAAPPANPPPPTPVLTSITVSPSSATLTGVGSTTQLTAQGYDQSSNAMSSLSFSWTSSNTSVATVSSSGLVTAKAAGSAQITAASGGVQGSAGVSVSVTPPSPVLTTITVSPSSATLTGVGSTTQLTARAYDASNNLMSGQSFNWTSSNTSVATVSSSGLVTAKAAGSAQITAGSGSVQGSASVTVSVPSPTPASVTVSPSTAQLTGTGTTTQLTARVYDASHTEITGAQCTWKSANTSVATVSSLGMVTAKAAGSVQITATDGTAQGSASVSVTVPAPTVATVSVSPASLSVDAGATGQLGATAQDASGSTIAGTSFAWSSSNTSVATVSSTGVVTGVTAGTATISASASGKTGSAVVTVQAVAPPPPPASGSTHEPSGFSPYVIRHFNSKASSDSDRGSGSFPSKTGGSEGWDGVEYRYPNISIKSDASAPISASSVMAFAYTAGTVPSGTTYSPGVAQTLDFTQHGRRLYTRFAFKLGSGYQLNSAGNKMVYIRGSDNASGNRDEPFLMIRQNGGQMYLFMNPQGSPDQRLFTANTSTAGQTDINNLKTNVWYTVEIELDLSGTFRMWLNGVQTHNYTDVNFGNVSSYWAAIHVDPTWGGQGGTINQTFYLYYDDWYVSGAN